MKDMVKQIVSGYIVRGSEKILNLSERTRKCVDKDEEPFKSEVTSNGFKSDSLKLGNTLKSIGMNASPNESEVERTLVNGKKPMKLTSRKETGKPSAHTILGNQELAITDSEKRPENGKRVRRGRKRLLACLGPSPQPSIFKKMDHQRREYVTHSVTSTINENINVDHSNSNDRVEVVTGESAIKTESKFDKKGIKKSVLKDLNQLVPNISTVNEVKYEKLSKVSTQIVANQKVCSELEIASEIGIDQQNGLLKCTSESDKPVILVPSQSNVPGKGNQSNVSMKNGLTQPTPPCGETSVTISITENPLCSDRNKVKFEASEGRQDKVEDLQKPSFVAIDSHIVSRKVKILPINGGYQEINRINLTESTKLDDSVILVESKRSIEELTLPITSNKACAMEELATSKNNGSDISKENPLNLINGKVRSRLKNLGASLIIPSSLVTKSGQPSIPVVPEVGNQYLTFKSSNSSDQIDAEGQVSLNENAECASIKTNPEPNMTRTGRIKEETSKSATKEMSVSNESTHEIPSKLESQLNFVPSNAHCSFEVAISCCQEDTEGSITSKSNHGNEDAAEGKLNGLRLRPRRRRESEWLMWSSIRLPPMVSHYYAPKRCAKKTGGKKGASRRKSSPAAKSSSKSNLSKKSRRQTEPPRNRLKECMNKSQEGNPYDSDEEVFGYFEACHHPRCKRPLKYRKVIRCCACERWFHHLCVNAQLHEITDPEYTCPDCRNEKPAQSANKGS
ncbi:unnamed protein product [Rodentolepis nana]|uniref:PHD-type domain-containing protein n=1 Tax=Rodentolepis nana TaxID=102285 RepID=A0A0R3T7Z7_RODNA|nr:unnamed protein product [Rodentolepis nana]